MDLVKRFKLAQAGFVAAAGLALLVWGTRMLTQQESLLANGIITHGRVVKVDIVRFRQKLPRQQPTVEFVTADGAKATVKPNIIMHRDYQVGQDLEVAYDPKSPQDAILTDNERVRGTPLTMLGMGLAFCLAAVAGFIRIFKDEEPSDDAPKMAA